MATNLSPGRSAELHAAVADACAQMNIVATQAELIKYTVNAVFRLHGQPIIVRVGAGDVGEARGARLVRVARWLAQAGAPISPILDGPQPVYVAGRYTVTFWHELSTQPAWSPRELADPLRVIHSLAPDNALPEWNPFDTARQRLAAADGAVARDDLKWLGEQWSAAEHDYRSVAPMMPTGIVHGDPHTGNLLRDGRGRVVLCDLDETGIGPLAWDLVPQAVGAVRFDRADFYAEFIEAYGADVRVEPFWPVLARIRELIMVTSVLPDLGQRPAVAAQHAHRLATLRAGNRTATWSLYR
ncbi:aminoglycoside phosphotransferase family protein [Nocardia brasiliensis]|uniref:aminoglycoside phosphotransferase family protein n=1 Tax=Nocardia brasiliensis TaxID=37326 RepID=UPI0024574B7A|nr:aminoglycoside phosphotransferase family protein [Nocardia brasiliensis]